MKRSQKTTKPTFTLRRGKMADRRWGYLTIRSEVADLMRDCEALVRKCKFLVQRSEFLYQSGLTMNTNAQQLVTEAARSGTEISALSDRMAKIEAKIRQRKKAKR